uniref:VASt domain-containing protein n=1 Tax=Macrostomum lignano TaxID=282301 RepID=A0A1I8FNX5_9PLAT
PPGLSVRLRTGCTVVRCRVEAYDCVQKALAAATIGVVRCGQWQLGAGVRRIRHPAAISIEGRQLSITAASLWYLKVAAAPLPQNRASIVEDGATSLRAARPTVCAGRTAWPELSSPPLTKPPKPRASMKKIRQTTGEALGGGCPAEFAVCVRGPGWPRALAGRPGQRITQPALLRSLESALRPLLAELDRLLASELGAGAGVRPAAGQGRR